MPTETIITILIVVLPCIASAVAAFICDRQH